MEPDLSKFKSVHLKLQGTYCYTGLIPKHDVTRNGMLHYCLCIPLCSYCKYVTDGNTILDLGTLTWSTSFFFFFFFFLLIYFERDRVCKQGWDTESKRERGSQVGTVHAEPDTGLELTNTEISTWAVIKSQSLNQLSHPGAHSLACS